MGLDSNTIKRFVSICWCVCEGDQIICESMRHMVQPAEYVQVVLQGVVMVDSLWIGGSVCKGRLG